MIKLNDLSNGCDVTKSDSFKGVWILSIATVYSTDNTMIYYTSLSVYSAILYLIYGVWKI